MKLINETKVKQKFQPDPFILEANGKFYIYCTSTDGVQAYRSTSLIGEYEDIGKVLEIENKKHFWAPSVIKTNGKYYMYVSCRNDNEKDVHLQTMYVASADSPTGPFSDARPLTLVSTEKIRTSYFSRIAPIILIFSLLVVTRNFFVLSLLSSIIRLPTQFCVKSQFYHSLSLPYIAFALYYHKSSRRCTTDKFLKNSLAK